VLRDCCDDPPPQFCGSQAFTADPFDSLDPKHHAGVVSGLDKPIGQQYQAIARLEYTLLQLVSRRTDAERHAGDVRS
jgi:hypothetical protein